MTAKPRSKAIQAFWVLVLLAPYVGGLWVPFYNRIDPTLFGVPFFYWFQFCWIIATAIITAIAYLCKA